MSFASRPLSARAGAIVVALAAGTSGFASPSLAATAAASTGPVSVTPASGTPALVLTAPKPERKIRQIVQCGGTMFAVGTFSEITQNGKQYRRPGLFSFSATAPYTVSGLNARVRGIVNSIAFNGSNCADAYIGGSFTSVNGTAVTNLAEISTKTGHVVSGFGHSANGAVDTLLGYKGHLLAGGTFTQANGVSRPYFASLSASTGQVDGFVNLNISGHVFGNPEQVYNQQLSHGGTLDLVEGNFTSVGGQHREQIFMLNLAGSTAKVTGWTSPEFGSKCIAEEAFYVRSAAWSPGDSTVYIATTGRHPLHWPKGHRFPLTGLCDAAAAFPATQTKVSHKWVEYAGCDSFYSVAADTAAVYVAGHPRWTNNAFGCNRPGRGAFRDIGLQGLNPATGKVLRNSRGGPLYTMSRANADSMLITGAGLWIASSNRFGSESCDHHGGHSGLCFLPYP